ncbi:hypothetical protein MTR_1g051110 [Medicago truncatula]|uniref:Uncharacterized protein n=1 Tax=Medicago truncatula TaxID=3880 RepID=G7I7Y7_MEDTR|nr:hypothetical protein MTR_1g051110 [Medicago truncatula]
MACDEAELGEEEFAEKMRHQQNLQEHIEMLPQNCDKYRESKSSQQLEMLKYMLKFNLDDQSAIFEKVHTSFQITSTLIFSNYGLSNGRSQLMQKSVFWLLSLYITLLQGI